MATGIAIDGVMRRPLPGATAIAAALQEATTHLTPEALDAAKAAAAIKDLSNVYYRFLHLTSNEKYRTMRAGLRLNVMRTPGTDPLNFEL